MLFSCNFPYFSSHFLSIPSHFLHFHSIFYGFYGIILQYSATKILVLAIFLHFCLHFPTFPLISSAYHHISCIFIIFSRYSITFPAYSRHFLAIFLHFPMFATIFLHFPIFFLFFPLISSPYHHISCIFTICSTVSMTSSCNIQPPK